LLAGEAVAQSPEGRTESVLRVGSKNGAPVTLGVKFIAAARL
jgi:hypothetical protein